MAVEVFPSVELQHVVNLYLVIVASGNNYAVTILEKA